MEILLLFDLFHIFENGLDIDRLLSSIGSNAGFEDSFKL